MHGGNRVAAPGGGMGCEASVHPYDMTAYSWDRIKHDLNPNAESPADTAVSIVRADDFKKWMHG